MATGRVTVPVTVKPDCTGSNRTGPDQPGRNRTGGILLLTPPKVCRYNNNNNNMSLLSTMSLEQKAHDLKTFVYGAKQEIRYFFFLVKKTKKQ